jgi:hypothetical protein
VSQPLLLDVTVRLDSQHAPQLQAIVAALCDCGLENAQAHTRFMIVSGQAPADRLDALRAVTGVESVRDDAWYSPQSD